jgi:23S rRNA (uridine2552-2'-O)-methyltransferase
MEETGSTPKRFSGIPKPVAVGDVIELTIESQGTRGDGIAKKDNFVIFVKGANQGETCKVKIIEVKRTFANGEKA